MKKRADEGRARLNGCQVGLDATVERFVSPQWRLPDPLPLEMVPDELVGVQLGRIARQEMQFQSPGQLLDVLGDHLGDMGGVAVEDEEHGARAAAQVRMPSQVRGSTRLRQFRPKPPRRLPLKQSCQDHTASGFFENVSHPIRSHVGTPARATHARRLAPVAASPGIHLLSCGTIASTGRFPDRCAPSEGSGMREDQSFQLRSQSVESLPKGIQAHPPPLAVFAPYSSVVELTR